MAKIARADDKIITKDLSKFISSLLDKIEMFYSKEYGGFRNTYASIFEYEKNHDRSVNELCSAKFHEKEIDFLICLLLDLIYYDAKMSANENALMENIIIGLRLNLINFREIKLKFETIKKNYRKLAKEYHYDNLYSKELPPELLKIAQEMVKKINLAYEIIKETRGV